MAGLFCVGFPARPRVSEWCAFRDTFPAAVAPALAIDFRDTIAAFLMRRTKATRLSVVTLSCCCSFSSSSESPAPFGVGLFFCPKEGS